MNTWTLVLIIKLGSIYEGSGNPLALESIVVENFSTLQSCENARNALRIGGAFDNNIQKQL